MAIRKFEGVDNRDEISELRNREDLRSIPQKLRDWWLVPDGQTTTFILLGIVGLVFAWAPFGGEFVIVLMVLFTKTLLGYKKKKWDFPLRVPLVANLFDGSTNRKGDGLIFLGNDVKTRLPAVVSDNDARTHALFFGTTGSGKTELLLAYIVNSLIYDGGGSYTDGKGDVKLWGKFIDICRLLGREDDLLLISFITSGHEFYDRQENRISNTMNMYSSGSSGMCTEASISLMDSSKGGDDMWKGRAIAFLGGLIKPMVFLRDKGEVLLSADAIREYFELPILERFVWDEEDTWKGGSKREQGYFSKRYGKVWDKVIGPLRAFMVTIPGYDKGKLGNQEQKTLEQHGYITMQLARLFGDIADNYGHIMQTPLGEVEMYDVVINDRILVTLLPALERSPESLGMLGKIIVGGIKQMAAGCLGNKVTGLRREIIDARPTNSPVPFPTIFDEYGYYAVLGFAAMPAQARSLGFAVIFAAQDFASLKKSSPEEADQTWENTNLRGIGRITSGGDAETYKRMAALGGNVRVAVLSGYERVFGMFRTRIRASENISIEERPRVNSDDLHSQANGEFHLFLGKMENEATKGRVQVVRVNAFYTDVKPFGKDDRIQQSSRELDLNYFAPILPPAVIIDPRADAGLYGPAGFMEAMKSGSLKAVIVANESRAPLPASFKAMGERNDALEGQAFNPLDLAFAFMVYAEFFDRKRNKELFAHLEASNVLKDRKPDVVTPTTSTENASLEKRISPPAATPEARAARMASEQGSPKTPSEQADVAAITKPGPLKPSQDVQKVVGAAVDLSPADKEALAKISLFTGGEISIPINTATEQQIIDLAQDMIAAAKATFELPTVEDVVADAMETGAIKARIEGIDPDQLVDVVVAAHPKSLGPEESAQARADGREFVNKMALGTTYLEIPTPTGNLNTASFLEAVEALNEAVVQRGQ